MPIALSRFTPHNLPNRSFVCSKCRLYRTKGALNKNTIRPDSSEFPSTPRSKLEIGPRPFLLNKDTLSSVLTRCDEGLKKKNSRRVRKWSSPTLADADIIQAVIDGSHLREYAGKTILEIMPGPGLLAERLIEVVKPKTYIGLEERRGLLPVLETLKSSEGREHDTELHLRDDNHFEWDTYTALEKEGLLDLKTLSHPRTEINPNLVFIATVKSSIVEQLVAQWIDTIGTNSWIQKFGRVRMYLFVNRSIRQRLLAQPGSPFRTKGTFIREATCDVREIIHVPYLQDQVREAGRASWKQDFDDKPSNPDAILARPDHYYPANALSLLEINPLEKPVITASWDSFDYLTKALLINRATPLFDQIRSIAPGAYAILASLPRSLIFKKPQDMTVTEINLIAVAFDNWPFKPKFLYTESYDADFKRSIARKYNRGNHLIRPLSEIGIKDSGFTVSEGHGGSQTSAESGTEKKELFNDDDDDDDGVDEEEVMEFVDSELEEMDEVEYR